MPYLINEKHITSRGQNIEADMLSPIDNELGHLSGFSAQQRDIDSEVGGLKVILRDFCR